VTTSELEELIARAKHEQWTELELNGKQLQILPESIGQLTNLRRITLVSDKIESLPKQIGQLTNLEILQVGDNQLKTIPEEISQHHERH
jgi:Leucine-rich repeat (LRR) protein